MALDHVSWRKSSHSGGNGGDCVELAHIDGGVAIRDTKNRSGGVLVVDPSAFGRFLGSVKAYRLSE